MSVPDRKIIAIGFYDGPTEGFVRGLESDSVHYFKVVAWDDGQDRRLYLLGRVEGSVFDQVLALLGEMDQPRSAVLTPLWRFDNAEREASVNQLVEAGRRALDSATQFALGLSLLGECEVVVPTKPQVELAFTLARLSTPGSLEKWLALGHA